MPDHPNQHGFTLIEIAVVLVIVGLMLGGLLMPLAAQTDQRNLLEARRQLEDIKEALIGHALSTGQLPCPARPELASTGSGAGIADCTVTGSGVLPWASLGLKETDPWGRRFTYRATAHFSDAIAAATYGSSCTPPAPPAYASFALCSGGNIDVLSAAGGNMTAANLPAVVLSHGKNGAGAYLPDGSQLPAGTDNDEKENSDADAVFVDHAMNPGYDDLLGWVPVAILLNRMVTAGMLP